MGSPTILFTNLGKPLLTGVCEAVASLYPGQEVFQLSSTPIKAHSVKITQRRLGAGGMAQEACYVGGVDVTVLTGRELMKPAAGLPVDEVEFGAAPGGALDLSLIYVLFKADNDGVVYTYLPV